MICNRCCTIWQPQLDVGLKRQLCPAFVCLQFLHMGLDSVMYIVLRHLILYIDLTPAISRCILLVDLTGLELTGTAQQAVSGMATM